MPNVLYENFRQAVTAGEFKPIAPDRLEEMLKFTNCYGPSNCWTGTLGTASTYIRELLREVEVLRAAKE